MCGAKNATVEIHPNVTYVARMCLYRTLYYHAPYLQPRLQNIEIPYRAFPELVGPRILSLESVDYFGTSDLFSGRKKKRIILTSKTSRFTGKLGSRICNGESGIEDHLKKKT